MPYTEISGVPVFGDPQPNAVEQIVRCARDADHAALMADHHLGYAVPIGGVVAYADRVSPSGVGYDIACGNKAVRLDADADDVRRNISKIMDDVARAVSFGVGRKNAERVDHDLFTDDPAWGLPVARGLRETARAQLGTVGSGNHYVDVFTDEADRVWVGVHFGSRGLGHKLATHFIKAGGGKDGINVDPVLLDTGSDLGREYVACMELAGRYAYAGRDWVCARVAGILGAAVLDEVHNHHNFCIAADQTVPTTAGPKRMDEVVPGDEVYAFSDAGPTPTRVTAHWSSGEKPIYAVSVGARQVRCSGQHPLLVVADGETVWRNAEHLSVGDVVVCADGFYPTDGSWGARRARLVGAFLGDGWIRHDHVQRRGYTLGLAVGRGDEPHTPRYAALAADVLPNDGWGKGWRTDVPGHFGLSCSSKSAWTAAVAMGLGERSAERRVPPGAFALNRDEKLALLAGYFDADGSVADSRTSNHGRGQVASVSERLVVDLRELALACGLQVTPVSTERRTTNYGRCTVYRCSIAASSMAVVPLWHERKGANQRVGWRGRPKGLTAQDLGGVTLPEGFFARRVRSIEVCPAEPVYDLTVEHASHSFIVEGVVTHNCWRETHGGRDLWVVRKGATPAFPGQRGFVGGSMGDVSVILEGVESDESRTALYSTVHGAGRVMSRTQAAGKTRWKGGKKVRVSDGAVSPQMMREWVDRAGVELRGAGVDESPHVYKRLPEVLAHHAPSVRVLHTLTPVGVAMAGADEFDPFRD